MAVQILPIIKAVAPYVAQVATAAIPAFTSKSAEVSRSDALIPQQIAELQAAATQNAESIHVLAEKIQEAMRGIEAAAEDARKQIAAYKMMLFAALGLSCASILLSIFLLVR